MKLFGSSEILIDIEMLHAFMSNKSMPYFLNAEPSNLVFLKTYNTDFGEIIITFTDENGRPLEIEEWHAIL